MISDKLTNNPKIWILIGVGIAVIAVIAATKQRRRDNKQHLTKIPPDYGAFVDRFILLPYPPPPPPAAPLPLHGLTFAIKDVFQIQGKLTGFGSEVWKKTHGEGVKTAVVITNLLKKGATCVGSTVLDEFSFGITGENAHYGTPVNPLTPQYVPGGSSSGAAAAVASGLADFALGTDSIGCVRIPAAFCGIFGFRASHGALPMTGVLPNSQSLDTIGGAYTGAWNHWGHASPCGAVPGLFPFEIIPGWFARDPSVLHRVGRVLLQLNAEPKRARRFIFADDLFELSVIPKYKTSNVVEKATDSLSGYQSPKHVNVGQHIASTVPSLKEFMEESSIANNGLAVFKALASVMEFLNRYEFRTNYAEWFASVKLKLELKVFGRVRTAIDLTPENIKNIYKVRSELRAALLTLLKDDGILVLPTVADLPIKRNSRKNLTAEFCDRALILSSLSSMSGCCQVTIPLGKHEGFPISVSFIAFQGADMFLLDTITDCHLSLRKQVNLASESMQLADLDEDMDAAELLKEKGNAAYKERQWNKAVRYYTEAIKQHGTNATYYSNRAAAYLELGCFQRADGDCTKAISLDKKNVKAYLRRGTARESLVRYKEAAEDFNYALVLEPQNKVASTGQRRLKKLLS